MGQKIVLFGLFFPSVLTESLLTIILLVMIPQIQAFDNILNVERHNPGP